MSKNNPNTDEILDAIKNMMSDGSVQYDQDLPKDVIELTNPIDEEINASDEKIDILELKDPIINEINTFSEKDQTTQSDKAFNIINDDQIKQAVRNAIDSLPSSRLNEIIDEELTRIIVDKLNSSKIIISTKDKKN